MKNSLKAGSGVQKPVQCLVIQLASMSDNIQSLMALMAAKQLYPNLEITYVVRDRFSDAAKRIPWIKEVVELPVNRILGNVMRPGGSEQKAYSDLAIWSSQLLDQTWDFVVNWSFSPASSYLAALVPGKTKIGYGRKSPDLSMVCADDWSGYIQGVVQTDLEQNIHVTDILTTQLLTALHVHLGPPADAGNRSVTSKTFFSMQEESGDLLIRFFQTRNNWIGLQLGSDDEKKSWDLDQWVEFALDVLRRHANYNIVLLGGAKELQHVEPFLKRIRDEIPDSVRVLSLVGRTNFEEWTSVVGRCRWIIATDTAVVHLASVLGTRVLNLSIGQVNLCETGPYGNGHYVVSSMVNDETVIPGKAVYGVWSFASSEWFRSVNKDAVSPLNEHFSNLGLGEESKGIKVYRSKIRPVNEGGGVVYEPMLQSTLQMDDWLSMVTGYLARFWYCGWVPPIGHELGREQISVSLLKELRKLEESSDVILKIFGKAEKVALSLKDKASDLTSDSVMSLTDKKDLAHFSLQLEELDRLTEQLANTHQPLRLFAQMLKVMMHNIKGQKLAELSSEAAESYKKLAGGVGILRDWIKHSIQLSRPVMLKKVERKTDVSPNL